MSKNLKEYKKNIIPLTEKQKEVLIGIMLGDLNIQKRSKKGNYRLRFEMTSKNKIYIYHLYDLFKNYVLKEPYLIQRKNILGNLVETIRFHTISHPHFDFLGEIFIKENRKIISINSITKYFTPISLSYWFMDDGGRLDYKEKGSKAIIFNTQGFKQEEVENLSKELNIKFGFKSKVQNNKKNQ